MGGGRGGMRTHYVCVPLTEESRTGLKAVQAALADDAKKLNFRPSGVDDAHFTFSVFRLDDKVQKKHKTEGEFIAAVNEVLKDFIDKRSPTQLTFGELGSFGAEIFFIKIANAEELATLRQDLNKALEKKGLILADKRFTPHVTLYRAKDDWRGNVGGSGDGGVTVEDMVKRTDLPPVAASPVNQLFLRKLRGF